MQTVILHSDLNNFYASVECLYRPELRDKPMAVAGDPEKRHGIILAKNDPAKNFGVKTGEALWQARGKCPGLIVVPPNFPLYLKFSQLVRSIYSTYTNQVESFGLDEAWLDVSGSTRFGGDGVRIADDIRKRVKSELGITASVGVSFNKVFAKLGSDMQKPDATTPITREDYQKQVWPLPVSELLYVGRATTRKLYRYGINTIGDLALVNPDLLRNLLGKWGEVLWLFANGRDHSPVARSGEEGLVKSVGNSTTPPRDLQNDEDAKMTFMVLCESVAARLKEQGLKCRTVQIHVRDKDLLSFDLQGKLPPTNLAAELLAKAMTLFQANYRWPRPIRSLGVRACDLVVNHSEPQLSLFNDEGRRLKEEKLESTVDDLRHRFGHSAVQRAVLLHSDLGNINPKEDHVIHPTAFFKEGELP